MKKICAVLIATTAVFTGCHTGGAYTPNNTTKYDVENTSPFVELDSRVARSVTTSGLQETRLPDGRMQVAANVRNREERRIEVQINCEFKDAQGFVIDSTPFQTLILREREQKTVSWTSMNNQAQKYTIRVSEAH
jgi:uncharacterized protein YcfL